MTTAAPLAEDLRGMQPAEENGPPAQADNLLEIRTTTVKGDVMAVVEDDNEDVEEAGSVGGQLEDWSSMHQEVGSSSRESPGGLVEDEE